MQQLSSLQAAPPSNRKRKKRSWAVQIRDARTRQTLVVESDEPIEAYELDVPAAGWPSGEKHPDGVVIGRVDGVAWVCFIELKGSMREKRAGEEPGRKALDQLEGGVRHFHPTGRGGPSPSHGADHHDRWASEADSLPVAPDPDHRVIGIALAFRHVPRPPPRRPLQLGSTAVALRAVQLSAAARGEATLSFRELLQKAGELAG